MHQAQSQSYLHTNRAQLDRELARAKVELSLFPFERKFESFESDDNVILYRCIKEQFDHTRDNIDWSLSIAHALEYASWSPDASNMLLITQVAKEELLNNLEFYSRSGKKIGFSKSPDSSRIAVTSLERGSIFTEDVLASMKQVLRLSINPSDSEERGVNSDFDVSKLKFTSRIYEWQTSVLTASRKHVWDLPIEIVNDYNQKREDRPEIS